MSHLVSRREFVWAATGAAVAIATAHLRAATPAPTLRKALIGTPNEATLRSWKVAGFDGIESTARSAAVEEAAAARRLADGLGMRIHSVLYGWANFNRPASLENDIAGVEAALRACQAYGADALLLVPCRIGGMPMPTPWEFSLRFDDQSGHLTQVVNGDNAKYRQYIEAHDQATDAARAALRRLVPAAEKAGVVIALENVWNNLWVQPEAFRHFVASFDSPWVRAYFDIGNHVKYGPPQEWIRVLGKLIVKCHVKDFKLNADGHGGRFCNIREGSIDWLAVRSELEKIGYRGWMTIEGGDLSVEEHSRRLDLIIADK
jgi:hexulose-6-phosphate isomerase